MHNRKHNSSDFEKDSAQMCITRSLAASKFFFLECSKIFEAAVWRLLLVRGCGLVVLLLAEHGGAARDSKRVREDVAQSASCCFLLPFYSWLIFCSIVSIY